MKLLEKIFNKILLEESLGNGNIEDAIDDAIENHKRVIISYHTNGEDFNTGARESLLGTQSI